MVWNAHRLVGRLIPAVPVPCGTDGKINASSMNRYADWMIERRIGGVAVWAHTGRGLKWNDADQDRILTTWRKKLDSDRALVAAAGSRVPSNAPSDVIASATSMARRAADQGADLLLVHPPTAFRGQPNEADLVLDYHHSIASAGLPLILFYLYEAAGGISYMPDPLAHLLDIPSVVGIKIATLDSVMTFQDIVPIVHSCEKPVTLLTGEDRFLGYSLMAGAQAALIGMAAACTDLQADFLASHQEGDIASFFHLNKPIDDLAQNTFIAPMEGYIQRMLWCLVHQGVIPPEFAHDPWAPALDPEEFTRLGQCVERLATYSSKS